jgi:hypothetical protein
MYAELLLGTFLNNPMKFLQLLLLVLAALASLASAQEQKPADPKVAGQSSAPGWRLRPGIPADVSVSIPFRQPGSDPQLALTDSRAIRVFRCEEVAGRPELYLHEPLWSFVEQATSPEGFPSFVRKFLPGVGPDGAELIEVEVQLSSREVREFVRRTIIESERERLQLAKMGVQPESVQVMSMAPLEAVMELTAPGGFVLLATCETKTAINWDDRAVLTFVLEPEAEKKLVRFASTEQVMLKPTFTFQAFETGTSDRSINVERTLKLVVSQNLDAAQEAGTGKVLQEDIAKIEKATETKLKSELRVSHREMLSAQNLSVAAPLMELLVEQDLKPEDFANMKPEQAKALAERLVPLVKKQIASSGGESSDVSIVSRENGKEKSATGGLSLGIGPVSIGGGAGAKWSERDLEQLEKASGVHFEKSTETGEYVAQSAKLYTLRNGWQTAKLTSSEVVYVTLSAGPEARSSTPVPQTFTAEAVKARAGEKVEDVLYHGVPFGTMLPFFGVAPPPGFVRADGKSFFPDDPRVPEHLRGKPVPNMTKGLILSGTSNAEGEYVGQERGAGTLALAEQQFAASADLPVGGWTLFDQLSKRHGDMFNDIAGADKSAAGKVVHNHGYLITKDARVFGGLSGEDKQHGVFEAPFNQPKVEFPKSSTPGAKPKVTPIPNKTWMLYSFLLDTVLLKGSKATGNVAVTAPARSVPVGTDARPPHVVCNWIIKVK